MTLLSAWALVGLALAVPLVLLHFWRRRPPAREVASLLSWRGVAARPAGGSSRFARPPLPLLLVLQLLVLALLVLALAKPQASGGEDGSRRVYVVDESVWMGAREAGETRIAAARRELGERLAELPGGEAVAIVATNPDPSLLFSGDAADAADAAAALPELRAGDAAADLATALRLAVRLRGDGGAPMTLLRAPEDRTPPLRGPRRELEQVVVGSPLADLGLEGATASCGPGGSGECEAFVRVRNRGGAARSVALRAELGDGATRTRTLTVAAGSSRGVSFPAPAGAAARFAISASDALAADDEAFAAVPPRDDERVTLVGPRERALPLARALAAVPGVQLRLRTPAQYRAADARTSNLLVLDGFAPQGGLPAAPALLLVDPPRLPGGDVGSELRDSRLSGEEPGDPLLEGVELAPLTIGAGAARRISPPDWLRAVAWSPDGPLLSAGSEGGRRIAVLAFEPAETNLPQLSSFPLLISNLVAWAGEWAPAAAAPGEPLTVAVPPGTAATTVARGGTVGDVPDRAGAGSLTLIRPGLYTVTQRGPWGTRERTIAVNAGVAPAPATEPVELAAPAARSGGGTDLWAWALAAALLAIAAAIAYELWRAGGLGARPLPLALEAAGFVLVALALLLPAFRDDPPPTTLVLDRSHSVVGDNATVREWVDAIAECGDCEAVSFGGSGSDLEAGLALGLAETPDDGRVVLLSDGLQTAGEATSVAPRAHERGIAVDAAALRSPLPDAAVTRLAASPALHAGDPLSLQFTVRSSRAGAARISLFRDGTRIGGERVRLARGENPYLFSLRAPRRPGSYSYEVTVGAAGDSVPDNNAMASALRVAAPPSVLVAGSAGATIASTLAADGMEVTTVEPGALPETAAAYAGTDAVVLEDVPATALGASRAAALAAAVRAGTTGLLALGGPHSFSLGRYYDSPLQAALPVRSLEPGRLQRRNLAVELVLDRSGSMIDEVGGVPKIAMAQAAARGAVGFLAKHADELGIVSFDIKPRVLVPLTKVTAGRVAESIESRINGLIPDGGTDIYRGLAAGVRELEASTAPHRHVILMSDGISEPGSYRELLPRLRADDVSVAAVALGDEADVKLLKGIAEATGGNYYETENARELPRIFAKETRLNARPVLLHGRIGVSGGAPSPVVASLVGEDLPPLRGNVVTALRGGAAADLLGADKDHPPAPVLAQWQYGLGRAVAWTPGLRPDFAGAWAGRPRLFQDAARWAERGVEASPLTPRVAPGEPRRLEIDTASTGAARFAADRIEGTLRLRSGRTASLSFERTAPGRYVADLPRVAAGVHGYAVAGGGREAAGLLAVPYPAERLPGPAEATPLGPLAAATGGDLLDPADPGALGNWSPNGWWWLALAGLIAFLTGAALALLGPGRRGPPRRPWLSFVRDSRTKDNHEASDHNVPLHEPRPSDFQPDRV